jgi:DNA invertase Pin-like site-specific DNA recombinase
MLSQIERGIPYRTIASEFGVSLGFLTKLKEKYADLLSEVIKTDTEREKRVRREKCGLEERKEARRKRDRRIREMLRSGLTYRDIVKALGCSLGTVSNVARRSKE